MSVDSGSMCWPIFRGLVMQRRFVLLLCLLSWTLAAEITVFAQSANSVFPWDGRFARNLSTYNLFKDPVLQIPQAGVIPFDIITPLFSDYAHKSRFLRLPPGTKMEYTTPEAFSFPVGTVLIKTFYYPLDFREPDNGRQLIETRLLVNTKKEGWLGAAYAWNAEQTEATLAIAGRRTNVDWVNLDGNKQSTTYAIPNMNQCRFCHGSHDRIQPLGLTARQLNTTFPNHHGHTGNQLSNWAELDIIHGLPDPDAVPHVAKWNDAASGTLFERTRSYVDTNCSHCHNPGGLAKTKRIDLRYQQTDLRKRGVDLRSTGGSHVESGLRKIIMPGHPEHSSLYLRVNSSDFTFMMPQIGRTLVHKEGAALVAEWIRSLQNLPVTDD